MPSANERPSLGNLRRSLPPARPPQAPPELEERLLDQQQVREAERELGSVPVEPAVPQSSTAPVQHADSTAAVQPVAIPPAQTKLKIKPGKEKPYTRAVTYKLPVPLLDRLSEIAEYNNVSMTEIVTEALERHLPNFPSPPKTYDK